MKRIKSILIIISTGLALASANDSVVNTKVLVYPYSPGSGWKFSQSQFLFNTTKLANNGLSEVPKVGIQKKACKTLGQSPEEEIDDGLDEVAYSQNGMHSLLDAYAASRAPASVSDTEVVTDPTPKSVVELPREPLSSTSTDGAANGDLLSYLESTYPKGCEYTFPSWSRSEIGELKLAINDVIAGSEPRCHASDCATASYLALLEKLKGTPHFDRLKPELGFGDDLYATFVTKPNSIERTFKDFNLGPYRKFPTSQCTNAAAEGWPAEGDIMLLNRKNGSGHMTVFSHYEKDGAGKPTKVCFWSSNKGTNGMGMKCESLSSIASIHVGKVE